jgi:cephalosporin-C deacetylase-like acetyl esterase
MASTACTTAHEPSKASVAAAVDLSAGVVLAERIQALAAEYDTARRRRLASVNSPEDWAALATKLRARLRQALGDLPIRTPLNPRVVGVITRRGYRIEKVLFESRPRFLVTANVYIPDQAGGPYPGVLSPLGHWELGKAEQSVQAQSINLARRGFLVLTYDPLGQGERSQYWDAAARHDVVDRGVLQHARLGHQAALSGVPLLNYFIWDGLRALDYLVSRSDVDKRRVAVTGASGGGLQTLLLAALDDRVRVAAPTLFVSSQRRWLETGLVADSEQVGFGWLRDGLDHPELCALVAPRPLLLNAATHDFFPIRGTRETFAEAKPIYELLRAPAALSIAESDGAHEYSRALREAVYAWMSRWLSEPATRPMADRERRWRPEPPEALWCTPSGQVASLGSTTVFRINRERAEDLAASYPATRRRWQERPEEGRREVLEVLGASSVVATSVVRAIGHEQRQGYSLTRLVCMAEPDTYLPGSDFTPESTPGRSTSAVLLVDARRSSSMDEAAVSLARSGLRVMSIDPRGMGEARRPAPTQFGADDPLLGNETALTHDAWLLGANLVGWRVRDVLSGLECLRNRPGVDRTRVRLAGIDPGGATLALFAAAIDERVGRTALVRPLVSYASVARTQLYRTTPGLMPWAVLTRFDLPQVVALAARRPLLIVNAADAAGEPIGRRDRAILTDVGGEVKVVDKVGDPLRFIAEWLRR